MTDQGGCSCRSPAGMVVAGVPEYPAAGGVLRSETRHTRFTDYSLRSELFHDKNKVHVTMVQMPGMNTTQFGGRSRLPNKPQPVPPISQPEVAADAAYGLHTTAAGRSMSASRPLRRCGGTSSSKDSWTGTWRKKIVGATAPGELDDPNRPAISGSQSTHGRISEPTAASTTVPRCKLGTLVFPEQQQASRRRCARLRVGAGAAAENGERGRAL